MRAARDFRFATTLLVAALLCLPSQLMAAGQILDIHEPLGDFDTRVAVAGPTVGQQAAADALGASVTWNEFGTPRSMIVHGGFLGSGYTGSPEGVARQWIEENRDLFALSLADAQSLELYRDAAMPFSDGRAVIFRQRFDSFLPTLDGLIAVGVIHDKVAYVSSSLTDAPNVIGSVVLTAQEAWLSAAANLGQLIPPTDLGPGKTDADWTVFSVDGLAQLQRARLTALPIPGAGVRQAFETLFVDVQGGASSAYRQFVDAETGEVWVRQNLVHRSHPAAETFSGVMPAGDGVCDADQGPWVIGPTETVISIDVLVEAALTTNDSVIHLVRDGVIVASQDTLFSPEAIHYEPAGGVPSGSYGVRVCDFSDGFGWDAPADYFGSIAFNDTAGSTVAYPPKWRVFESSPRLPALFGFPWNLPDDDIRTLWCWDSVVQGSPVPGCESEVGNLAARVPWDHNVRSDSPTFTSLGNNANTAESWSSPLTPGLSGQRASDSNRTYSFSWDNRWKTSGCNEAISGVGSPGGNDIESAVANLFVMHNRMHDWSYFLGFTEETWNAQAHNFGSSGLENDPVIGDAQAGALDGGYPSYLGRDNANMITLPDGVSPITNMYLWQPLRGVFYAPCVDGDYDMSVIGHEYTHMTENRLTGKGGSRSGHHAGAMGESWGDLMGVEYLNEYGFVPVDDESPFAVGPYDTGDKHAGIRNYNMSVSPLNFSNMGYDFTGPQVHADGEIWSATQFDVRQILNDKYDAGFPSTDAQLQAECADGLIPPGLCPGNRRWVQLAFDAMLLSPVAPSMLDMRDAMLAADMMRTASADAENPWTDNQAELWLAYARQGLGENAASSNSAANTDTDPSPDFGSPLENNATVTFDAVAGGASLPNARIYVGHYEARTSPVADTNPATSAPNLDAVASFAPGSYEFVAHAPGYGHVRFSRTFSAGEVATVTVEFRTNHASQTHGATASGHGVRFGSLIDDTEATNWESTGALVTNRQVTVDLAGSTPITVDQVNVSAMLTSGQNRFTALRQFRIDVSTDGVNFSPAFTSDPDAFPGTPPRPRAPSWILRSFPITPVAATHVRLVVLNNQCTGNTLFQGVQDDDPLNVTDCRSGQEIEPPNSFAAQDTAVRVAELQVFGTGGPDPIAVDDFATTDLNTFVDIDVLDNDITMFPPLTILAGSVTDPANGTAVDIGGGVIRYTPDFDFTGTDTFQYTACNANGDCDPATVTVTVGCPTTPTGSFFDDLEGTDDGDDPTGHEPGWSFDTAQNTQNDFNWRVVTDLFAESPDRSFSSDAINKPGVKDDRLVSPPVTPSATSQLIFWHRFSYAVATSGPVDGAVLEVCFSDTTNCSVNANWSDITASGGFFVQGGYTHTMRSAGNPGVIPGRSAWSGFSEFIDAMSEVVVDLGGFDGREIRVRWRNTGDNTIVIGSTTTDYFLDNIQFTNLLEPDPDCPIDEVIARDDAYTTEKDTPLNVPAPGVLANDTGTGLTANGPTSGPANGGVVLNSDGSFTYTPNAGFTGTDTFDYEACNDSDPQVCDPATVTITVVEGNRKPVANDDGATIPKNTSVIIPVLANDSDPDGDDLRIRAIQSPTTQGGTAVLDNNGTPGDTTDDRIEYTPPAGFAGIDTFAYEICDRPTDDPPNMCDSATVTVTVQNRPPLADDDAYETDENVPLNVPAPGVLGNDQDPDGDPLTASGPTSGPMSGNVVLNADGSFTYTPNPDFFGTDSFTYQACDNGNPPLCDEATVTITVHEVPEPGVGDKVTGGGWLLSDEGQKINFGFNAKQKAQGPQGNLQLNDKSGGVKIHLSVVNSISNVTGSCGSVGTGPNSIEFSGMGTFNNLPAEFRVCVEDNGEPGNEGPSSNPDRFYLECTSGCGYSTGARTPDDLIDGGNIQLHRASATGGQSAPESESFSQKGSSGKGESFAGGESFAQGEGGARVLLLQPLLQDTADLASGLVLTAVAYDATGEPVSSAMLSVRWVGAAGTGELPVTTGLDGTVAVAVPLAAGDTEYMAVSGAALTSNAVEIRGE